MGPALWQAPWSCGAAATDLLRRLVADRDVVCEGVDTSYDRIVAICRAGDDDLAAALVAAGLAIAYRRYSKRYVPLEDEAKAARRGAWAGAFIPPQPWRRRYTPTVNT